MAKTKGHIHKVHRALDFLIVKSGIALMSFLMAYLVLLSTPLPFTFAASTPSVAVPSYFLPGPLWDQMSSAGSKVGIAVMNPANGPGVGVNPAYLSAVNTAKAAGIKVLGYVSTSYGSRPAADVLADIATFYSNYGVSGIFLDEGPTDCGAVAQYQAYVGAIRSKSGYSVINPGTMPQACWGDVADTLMVYEGAAAGYANFTMPAWTQKYPATKFWHAIYGASAADLPVVAKHASDIGAGYLYVTDDDDSAGNPYDSLPTYWQQLVSGSASTPPGGTGPGTTGPGATGPGAATPPDTKPETPKEFTCTKENITTPGLFELMRAAGCETSGRNPIYSLLEAAINWLTGILGGLAVLVIIIAGIQYITSGGSPDVIKRAKSRITSAVVGIIVLSLMFFILKLIGIVR